MIHTELGQPFFDLTGRAAELYGGWQFSLSISHTDTQAVAFVLASHE